MIPRVSVVIPTRNRHTRLQNALLGVQRQSFQNYELIVVDDGSTDETLPWLHAAYPAARIHTMEKTGGAARARNRGLQLARGEFVAFLDDDDVWEPEYLAAQVENFKTDPGAVLSYSNHIETDASGHCLRPDTKPLFIYSNPFVRLLAECFIHTLSVVVCRRDAFDRFGPFNESLQVVHDLDWYQRVLAGGGAFLYQPRALVKRSTPGGLVTSHRLWFREERDAHSQALARHPLNAKEERFIRVYRSLFFASIALGKRDWNFGMVRLASALSHSPVWAFRIVAQRLLRRMRFERKAS